jgi:hypothetical protein
VVLIILEFLAMKHQDSSFHRNSNNAAELTPAIDLAKSRNHHGCQLLQQTMRTYGRTTDALKNKKRPYPEI